MTKYIIGFFLSITSFSTMNAQNLEKFDVNEKWIKKIRSKAPRKPSYAPDKKPRVLLFSLHTGYYHWVIPHTDEVIKAIAEKSGAFTVVHSKSILSFHKDSLKQYDAVILNNNCSKREKRDLLWDALGNDIPEDDREKRAAEYEQNLLDFFSGGGGIVAIHGAIVMQNNSQAMSDMMGGSFDYHPPQQKIEVKLVDATHPLVKAFKGKSFLHIDEPYFFNKAYFNYNFRPLMYMEATKLHSLKNEVKDTIKYVAWIKKYGKGKVFYSSPAHNAQSFEDGKLMKFYLDGIMYVTGNLECDDSPIKKTD
jgi:uncharacterized protein